MTITIDRAVVQQALEALEGLSEPYAVLKAQDALRAALEQPEQEPVAWACFKNGELQTELIGTETDVDFWCASDEPEMQGMVKGALRAALAESANSTKPVAESEPVAWMHPSGEGYDSAFRDHSTVIACTGNKWEGWIPLYTHPPTPQRGKP